MMEISRPRMRRSSESLSSRRLLLRKKADALTRARQKLQESHGYGRLVAPREALDTEHLASADLEAEVLHSGTSFTPSVIGAGKIAHLEQRTG